MNASEIHDNILRTLAESAPSYATVTRWIRDFKRSRDSLNPIDTQIIELKAVLAQKSSMHFGPDYAMSLNACANTVILFFNFYLFILYLCLSS